ncbi:MAG: M20/M25/M40 family metallo-hydrolase [Gammaproteobacteria bacterium]
MKTISQLIACLLFVACSTTYADNPTKIQGDESQTAKRVLMDSIEFDTVEGRGKVPALAAYYAEFLEKAGFSKEDIEILPFGETATLAATMKGKTSEKPLLLIAHLDVVEADPADWERDPFTAIEEDGYIFGRGSLDNKFGIAMQITALAKLKREGYQPRQDIILVLSGDEETTQKSTEMLAAKYRHAGLVINSDSGGGARDANGTPLYYVIQAAEKSYSDFQLEFTDPGGHSSRPSEPTAITRLANALAKIGAHYFAPQRSELTIEALKGISSQVDPELGDAMRRFIDDPDDAEALALIRSKPSYIGQIGTTCVTTTIEAGHAVNALPQRATANINCRIFPGIPAKDVLEELATVIDDPNGKLTISWDPLVTDPSPLSDDVMNAVKAAVHKNHPELPVFPGMGVGTTDSILFRAQGVPSYGVGGLFIRSQDMYAHGLNERVPVDAIPAALSHWDHLIRALTGE